jgi:NifU-like protein involved in Fe-S cluster formation
MNDKNNKDIILDGYQDDQGWIYNKNVKEHFFHPKNLLLDESKFKADGIGIAGSPACGDMMHIWIKVDKKNNKIKKCKWRTFGCASAIASTSVLSVMVTEKGGMDIEKASKIKPEQIVEKLKGLPKRKFHCSVLGHLALREAINNYLNKTQK